MSKQSKPVREEALALLGRREHGVAELTAKLRRKGYAAAEVQAVIGRFVEVKLVDDARYAAARVRYRAEVSKWGGQKIAAELAKVGIDKEVAAAALVGLADEGTDLGEQAEKLARQKFGRRPVKVGPLPEDAALGRQEEIARRVKEKNKRIAFMVRRGFTFAQAKAAVEALIESAELAAEE